MQTNRAEEPAVPVEAPPRQKMSPAKKRRIATYSLLAILALSFVLPLGSYTLHFLGSEAVAQDAASTVNPRSNYWRAVKEGVSGYSAVQGQESNVLIAQGGTQWQETRRNTIAKYVPWTIVVMLALVTLYHVLHGRNKLAEPRSGRKIKRWNWLERLVHWVTAISFVALAITGLSMLVGRTLLIPLLGHAGFSLWAQASIYVHNVAGPLFTVGVIMMIVMWIWYNVPTATDIKWFKQGGGMVGTAHPSAGRMNGGEKIWFWVVMSFGLVVCVTGLLLVAPSYGIAIPAWADFLPLVEGSREQMRQANLIHAVVSLLWAAIAVGHIYIGTAGTEGAFEGMATGYVSTEWAKQHHDLWYDKMEERGKIIDPDAGSNEPKTGKAGKTGAADGDPATANS